jgi:hypothetical protein
VQFSEKLKKIDPLFPASAFDSSRFSFPGFKVFLLAKNHLALSGYAGKFALTV